MRVGAEEVRDHLSEYLDRAASGGERIVLERRGKPVAALVSLDDLHRLEALDQGSARSDIEEGRAARDARFCKAMADAGIAVRCPTGKPVTPNERKPLRIKGRLVSEQIIQSSVSCKNGLPR